MKTITFTTLLAVAGLTASCSKKASTETPADSTTEPEKKETVEQPKHLGLSKEQATAATESSYKTQLEKVKLASASEMKEEKVTFGDKTMPYKYITYGKAPEGGHSLYISMHGGGGAPPQVNDGQWRNQIHLYKPKEGIYLAPRAATDTWDLWQQSHIDPMFSMIIDRFVAHHGVNPNKVYVTGYSAGGDGTYQLAPRMADQWAGAAMMAGHPGDAKPHNLLNLAYYIQCGAKDYPYKRNELAKQWGEMLDKLEKENPGYYPHAWEVYPQHGHWMKLDCKKAIPWMAKHTRNPWPKKINWHQDNVTSTRFAWLANDKPVKDQLITAEVKGQTITLTTENVTEITLRLSDALLDLDQEITVVDKDGKQLFKGKVARTQEAITTSLEQRLDKTTVASALLKVKL